MKQLLMVFLIGLMVFEAHGQQSVDIGFFGGSGTYFGDMTKTEWQKSISPAYGAFMRFNFNPRYGLRFNVLNGNIGAVGEFDSQTWNANPTDRSWDFNKNVLDISLQFEFNYFKYIVGDKATPYSTYLFGGVGMQMYNYTMDLTRLGSIVHPTYFNNADKSGRVFTPTIPFGLGFKFNLSKRIGLGIEAGMRKTFSDKLDNLDDPLSYEITGGELVKYTDQIHNNDWTAYLGGHLVYKLIYGNKEWILRTPKEHILDWGIENNSKNR
ncbi:MAG: DUF6089 family protein [Bacteroidota bacterium]|nr:DUF6089 family protein [Bacteroidota bacterium]